MTGPSPSGSPHAHPARREYEVKPIGRVESPLADPAQAPRQAGEGAPPAWLVIEPHPAEGIRDLHVGEHIIVLTWLDRARRDELSTIPGDNPDSPPLGVFAAVAAPAALAVHHRDHDAGYWRELSRRQVEVSRTIVLDAASCPRLLRGAGR
jgi:hypothetical protein